MKIRWTPTAKRTYFNILDYLAENWTNREVAHFVSEVESLLNHITNYPKNVPGLQKKEKHQKSLNHETKHALLQDKCQKKRIRVIHLLG